MTQRASLKPWHEVVKLREDVRTGELSLAVFAADLYDVVMQKGQRPVYEDPAQFFALTYPTYNLRQLDKDVVLRLDGRSDKAYRKLSVNYGGGKTHTLIALRHLVDNPERYWPVCRPFRSSRRTSGPSRPGLESPRCASTRSTLRWESRHRDPTGPSGRSSIRGASWHISSPGPMGSG